MSPTQELAINIMEAFDKQGVTITYGEALKIAFRTFNDHHQESKELNNK